ncbi:MAG: 2-amino-4-hydroxy-6-hydroxymethyldihydropteridine diphosphokinase [Cyanobacteria bacterium P01_H01_bin.15]
MSIWTPCIVALGSNLGNSRTTLENAIAELNQQPQIKVIKRSICYETAPVGGPQQPNYLNSCVCLETALSPLELLAMLLSIEGKFGRVRQEKWGPRTLDLDLIFFGDRIINDPQLRVPHPRYRERGFVLVPLAEIAPNWRDPSTGDKISELIDRVDISTVFACS